MALEDKIILFHYAESVYSHRVIWYLKLAGIQYSECIQPPIMPRPDLANLGVSYRRIPLLSIGKHIYCDSRLILQVLQERYPLNGIALSGPDVGLQKLFQHWNIDQVFWHTASCIPFERSAFARDPAFLADRAEATGGAFKIEDIIKARPESYANIRASFDLLESFFKDGRKYILGGEKPSVVDVEAVYIAQWLITDPLMEGAVPDEYLSKELFPNTYAWVHRFKDAVKVAETMATTPVTLNGEEALERIRSSPEGSSPTEVESDPLGLKLGEMVEIWPTDWASNHHDRGELQSLTVTETMLRLPKKATQVTAKESYQLIYHPMSPYSRKVYMLALENGLEDRIQLKRVVVAPVEYPGWSDDNETVAQSNPLTKTPTLVVKHNNDAIYDSRMICDFLESEAAPDEPQAPVTLNWRLRTLHACADGVLDAQVLIVYEQKIRAEKHVLYQPWITGQQEKIMRGFNKLELEARRGTLEPPSSRAPATAAEVAVAACVDFMDINGVQWREGRSKLADWFKYWQERESFVRTRPDVDWKTGEASDLGFAREALAGKKS